MVIKPTINKKAGASHLSKAGPVQNVIYIADRDKTQSKRLHEPTSITSHTDPVTGNDVLDDTHPNVVDGIMKVHFESENTRKSYLSTPLNHPVRKLSSVVSADDDQGG